MSGTMGRHATKVRKPSRSRRRRAARRGGAWHLYILRCGDDSLYIGTTTDLERRLAEHGAGRGGAYTRGRLPVRVVYHEAHPDRASAQRREAQLKRLPRAQKLALAAAAGARA